MFYLIYLFFGIILIGILLSYHTYLLLFNQTTNENLKHQWTLSGGNPYF